jgi:sensor c-di-GMP phosphodiesterase-like protein
MNLDVPTRINQVIHPARLPNTSANEDTVRLLYDILNGHTLITLFQPIVDLRDCTILGHEGLIRGPSDSALHSPTK